MVPAQAGWNVDGGKENMKRPTDPFTDPPRDGGVICQANFLVNVNFEVVRTAIVVKLLAGGLCGRGQHSANVVASAEGGVC
jgi:hypothetical protein